MERSSSAGSWRLPRHRVIIKMVSLVLGVLSAAILVLRVHNPGTSGEGARRGMMVHIPSNVLWKEDNSPIAMQSPVGRYQLFRADHRVLARRALDRALGLRDKCQFRIIVFAWRRRASLRRLVDSLLAAKYYGFRVNIEFHFDGEANEKVVQYVENVDWPHGSIRINRHDKRIGLERVSS